MRRLRIVRAECVVARRQHFELTPGQVQRGRRSAFSRANREPGLALGRTPQRERVDRQRLPSTCVKPP